jgi:transmembrane sensor
MGNEPDMPDKAIDSHADARLSDEALEWIVRLHSGTAGQREHQAFERWRARSPGHEQAAQDAEALWQGLGPAGAVVRRKTMTRRVVLGGGIAITGAALVGGGVLDPHGFADHVTEIAERRTIGLPDGSSVFLNAGSALSVDFTPSARRLRLFRGQGTFSVAHDVARPFVVEAAGGTTQALGTVFDVDIRAGSVAVTVLEGTVGVATDAELARRIAAPDQRVTYRPGASPSVAEDVDAEVETAWRRGKLIFNARPLADVVAEIERYRGGRIFILGDELRALPVTGLFELREPEAVLDVIEQTLPVRVSRLPFMTVIR